MEDSPKIKLGMRELHSLHSHHSYNSPYCKYIHRL